MTDTFRWTDDPADPCPYCVHWDESDGPDNTVPVLPNGPVHRVYRNTHDECEEAVMRYVAEASR